MIGTACRHEYPICFLNLQRALSVTFCECESDALTLMRLRYWPGTPKRPVVAFSFALMDWLEVLLLECQVAVKDFATGVELRIAESFQQVTWHTCFILKSIYIVIMYWLPSV